MKYLFPYRLVKNGSDVLLYGGGYVGKDFYLQIRENSYCNIVAWVDASYDNYDVNEPFDYVRNIPNHTFDYCVIAIKNMQDASNVKKELIEKYNVDEGKIIWSNYYDFSSDFFPADKVLYLKDLKFFMGLMDDYIDAETFYSTSKYYQSFEGLGLCGSRNNSTRFMKYHITDFLSGNDSVLDIGCNCGFFSLTVAPFVKNITGVDIEGKFINIANKVKRYCGISNATFLVKDVFSDGIDDVYDAVFMLALPGNIGVYEKADMIVSSIKDNGYLFLESHFMGSMNEPYLFKKLVNLYMSKGLRKICLHTNSETGNRDLVVLRKVGEK